MQQLSPHVSGTLLRRVIINNVENNNRALDPVIILHRHKYVGKSETIFGRKHYHFFFLLIKTNNLRKHSFLFTILTFTINAAQKLNSQLRNMLSMFPQRLTGLPAMLPIFCLVFHFQSTHNHTHLNKSQTSVYVVFFKMNSVPMHFFSVFLSNPREC